ncbi:hypothetical protein MSG28_005098 [Choristoneura fumiferana]|uniref:Uncharacterized protein n=1 Tax=Choristoneura fumiferana TaxID=7141 RepID=A0ACC0JPY7_CHOFU|nr:hypothetical protein MSG28_005098 [Choristoneura fumiferana]
MGEAYFKLKRKLEDLGYNNTLPLDAVPLVECILADLIQTTRSLQHYMDLSKEALTQRDSLMLEAEPYKCDNAKLIQENNRLHSENINLKEEALRVSKESKRKIKSLSEELMKKDSLIGKLQHDVRDLSLRGLCAGTQSSRNKSRRKDSGDNNTARVCICNETQFNADNDVTELLRKVQNLEEKNESYYDEIILLKSQIELRDNEIVRLHILLEGGRPLKAVSRDVCTSHSDGKFQDFVKQLQDMAKANDLLKKQVADGLEKQHEAMQRALDLADKNKNLHDELKKVDTLALTVEEDCNKRIAAMMNDMNFLQVRIEGLTMKNAELTKELSQSSLKSSPTLCKLQEELNIALREKDALKKEITDLVDLNKSLQDKIISVTSRTASADSVFIKELHKKLCECQQEILMLKKENDEMKTKNAFQEEGNKQNYKDIISHLNAENAELSKENIALSHQLSQYKNFKSARFSTGGEYTKRDILKLQDEIDRLRDTIQIVRKDKEEYMSRCKEAMDLVDKLKRDLSYKHREIEQLQEENSSYKMTHRTGKASADHLREECNFLREQIKTLQSDVIKEKTLASQIKNIQMETERSSNEVQSDLLCTQKKLSLAKDNIDSLERKCNILQSEIVSLKNEKSNLIENIKKIDQERDKLVIELDNKTENMSILEQKIKSQSYEISKLENEISELKRKISTNKVSEHRKEVDGLKQQLQHYVAEIRRIEEMLSQKEAERSDMLEHFASLSVEANILENTNHSLESESASKSLQLQSYISKIQALEERSVDKDNLIDTQSSQIAAMTCKITALENEVKLISEEKDLLQQNVSYLKQMCNSLQKDHTSVMQGLTDTDSELKLYENKIKNLSSAKTRLEADNQDIKGNLETTEKLLSKARREIVELKLALQDATSETKALQDRINRLSRIETVAHESTLTREELELPLMLEETIHEIMACMGGIAILAARYMNATAALLATPAVTGLTTPITIKRTGKNLPYLCFLRVPKATSPAHCVLLPGAPRKQGFNKSGHSMNPDRPTEGLKGVGNPRTKGTIKRLQMYRNFKAKRDKTGKIITPAPFQGWLPSGTRARVEPNQKWFGNSRVISQNALQKFQDEFGAVVKNPYQVVMKPTNLPITLLNEKAKQARVHLLDTEGFDKTFGPKKQRKRVNLKFGDLGSLSKAVEENTDKYDENKDIDRVREDSGVKEGQRDWVFGAGMSKRIWNELYKVIDSSDVLLQVLDARDPMGTRSPFVENFLKKEKAHKHLIFVLNKVDLVPNWVTQRWVAILSAEYPTVAFHSSLTHPFGKGSLINLLRQFGKLHIDKKQISVGLIGYPNVGKSSVINTLRSKKVCKVAPIAGETKVWQYITLMKRIFLIDCPGVVYPSAETDTEKVLKGVVRVELVQNPEDYIDEVIKRVRKEYLVKTYKIDGWETATEFLEKMAARTGKLLKKGEPDINQVARMVLNDWQRGKLPFYVAPEGFEVPLSKQPKEDEQKEKKTIVEQQEPEETSTGEDVDDKSDNEEESQEGDDAQNDDGNESSDISDFYSNDENECSDVEDYLTHKPETVKEMRRRKLEAASGSFTVEEVAKQGKKRKAGPEDANIKKKKMTAKERRAFERAQRRTKTGSNFYEVSNMSSDSESDEEFVPGEPEQLSEEDSADEETDLQFEKEQEHKTKKRKAVQDKDGTKNEGLEIA